MRNILTLLLASFLFANCNNSQVKTAEKNDRIELIPEPDRHERLIGEAIQKIKFVNCEFLDPDTSISDIILRNSKSADKVIGTNNISDERGQYHFYSKMDAETLTLTQHPGDGKNQISIFNITYSDKADHGYKQLNIDAFKTEKGIKLGMSKSEVLSRLGNCYVVVDSTKELIELYYRLENPKDSKTNVLKNHNMPAYYAIYEFWKNELKNFEFGFEYP